MKILDPKMIVSGQITVSDLPMIADLGVTDIICNRPDGESFDQQNYSEIEKAAKDIGLLCHAIPIGPQGISLSEIEAFTVVYAGTKGKILAYCTSGTRCCALWLLSRSTMIPPDTLLSTARKQGYELDVIRPMMTTLFAKARQKPSGAAPEP